MMLWKHRLAATLFAAAAAAAGMGATGAHAQDAAQPAVNWTLDVLRDGQQIDQFTGATTVGQARTETHHHVVAHNVGCKDQPAGNIDLQRAVTVSPLQASASETILAIDAQETLESATATQARDGCKLPPEPRRITASHPGLRVAAGESVSWQIVDTNPSLAYRISASLAPQRQ